MYAYPVDASGIAVDLTVQVLIVELLGLLVGLFGGQVGLHKYESKLARVGKKYPVVARSVIVVDIALKLVDATDDVAETQPTPPAGLFTVHEGPPPPMVTVTLSTPRRKKTSS